MNTHAREQHTGLQGIGRPGAVRAGGPGRAPGAGLTTAAPEPARGVHWQSAGRVLMTAILGLAATGLALDLIGCQATRPPDDGQTGDLRVTLDVIPLILPADTTMTATVWVTVMAGSEPVADSTRVRLVASAGTVPTEVRTSEGMAITNYRPSLTTGIVTIIAQVLGVRDTMNITIY